MLDQTTISLAAAVAAWAAVFAKPIGALGRSVLTKRGVTRSERQALLSLVECLDALIAKAGDALLVRPTSGQEPSDEARGRIVTDLMALWEELRETQASLLPKAHYRSLFAIKRVAVDLCDRSASLMADRNFSEFDLHKLHAGINQNRVELLLTRISLA